MTTRTQIVYLTINFVGLLIGVQHFAKAELIYEFSGNRVSHSQFGFDSYPSGYRRTWSFHVPCKHYLLIEVRDFSSEVCCDHLKMHLGLEPNYLSNAMFTYSGNHARIYHEFADDTTLVFTTDGSVNGMGFKFYFNVTKMLSALDDFEQRMGQTSRISAEFQNWSGKISNESSFRLSVQPMETYTRVDCLVPATCGFRPMNFSMQTSDWRVFEPMHIHALLLPCISRMECRVQWRSGSVAQQIDIPQPRPQSLRIELIKPETWLLTGVIRFLAVSEIACPNVRHQCELKVVNHTSRTVQSVDLLASGVTEPKCEPSSVVTPFFILTQPWITVGSEIVCHLSDGKVTSRMLPFEHLHKTVWNMSKCSGKSSPLSFSVSLKPPAVAVVGQCRIGSWCSDHYVVTNKAGRLDSSSLLEVFEFHNAAPSDGADVFCIREITCRFSTAGGQFLEASVTAPATDPESASVELVNHELWSLTSTIQFRVVSDPACLSVRHRCELRAANGSSLHAQHTDRQISQLNRAHCYGSVRSQFYIVTPTWFTIAGSVIACRLNNGSFIKHGLPTLPDNPLMPSPKERQLLLVISVTAAVSLIATCFLATAMVIQSDCWRSSRIPSTRPSATPGMVLTAQQGSNQQTENTPYDVYDDDAQEMECSGVYVV